MQCRPLAAGPSPPPPSPPAAAIAATVTAAAATVATAGARPPSPTMARAVHDLPVLFHAGGRPSMKANFSAIWPHLPRGPNSSTKPRATIARILRYVHLCGHHGCCLSSSQTDIAVAVLDFKSLLGEPEAKPLPPARHDLPVLFRLRLVNEKA